MESTGYYDWDLANEALSGRTVEEKQALQGSGTVRKMEQGLFG